MLKLTNLTKIYRDFTLDCSLEVRPGTVTGFIGANGAGKSTTFKAILGLISHDGGEIELFGSKRKVPTVEDKRRIGFALAESGFSGELTVKDVSAVLAAFYPAFDRDLFRKRPGNWKRRSWKPKKGRQQGRFLLSAARQKNRPSVFPGRPA